MSALSIFKPAQAQAAPLSVEALLGAATKKSAKSNNHLIYNGTDTRNSKASSSCRTFTTADAAIAQL